ncbi:hypothetical protein [Fictibacillus sp. JL2B1089]|uniref:hypothetical protein n=1 Tax=Fictibacillus sp. JL2B1089 TaxID=3399565 RepID=UPI003A83B9D3
MKSDIMYPFGFLLSRNHQFLNKFEWHEFKFINGWEFYYSPKNEFVEFNTEDTQLVIIGYFFDVRNGQLAEAKIIHNLIKAADRSYDYFLEELSYLSGRYLLILSRNDELKLFHDVSGLRAVCYHTELDIIASHDSLVKEVANHYKCSQIYFKPSEISFSYNTRYANILKLIPNMSYEVNARRLERYYPTKLYTQKTKFEIKEILKKYLYETVKWLQSSKYQPILSLTGGGDSRTSLAILKPIIHNIEMFTYMKDTSDSSEYAKKTFDKDKKIVSSLVENLNLNHRFFEISKDEEINVQILKTIKHNVMSNHGLNLANDYYYLFGHKNYMHIRSTALFNVGKYIFPNNTLKIKEWDLQSISKNVQKWTNIADNQKNMDHLEHLLKHAQLENWYNYNPLELLFVSYRLIQWHSGVVGESDIAFNTMLLLNSRSILDLLLAYPIEDRSKNKLFTELIDELWPVLNYWEINSLETLKSNMIQANNKIEQLERVNRVLFPKIITVLSSQIEPPKNLSELGGITYKFTNQNINADEYYELTFDLSGFNEYDQLILDVEFFYNNPKGRNRITVSSNILPTTDILNLYGRHKVVINVKDYKTNGESPYIKIMHLQSTTVRSWIEASRIWVGDYQLA